MQRIDENTYIDDTLVTCAEYQLFIDEMREQGKYYQPDHWASYQFLEGQAQEPILGVRHSDAVAFCEWLTKRENGEWIYCLPTREEAQQFPTKPINQSPIGYWLHREQQLVWVGTPPEKDRDKCIGTYEFFIDEAINNCASKRHLSSWDPIRVRASEIILLLAIEYEDCSQSKIHPISINRIRNLEDTNLDRDYDHALEEVFSFFTSVAVNRADDFAQPPHIADPGYIARELNSVQPRSSELSQALDYYRDISILCRRAEGKDYAFEAIRLVKQHKTEMYEETFEEPEDLDFSDYVNQQISDIRKELS